MPTPESLLSCPRARRAIREALEPGGLPGGVARHIQACEACGREAEDLERLVTRLRALPVEEPAAAFWQALPAQVLRSVRPRARPRPLALAALAAAAALVLMIVPGEREQRSRPSGDLLLAAATATDSWSDSLERVGSPAEVARVVQMMATATGFGAGAIERIVQVVDEEAVGRPDARVWNLLDRLGPQELERVVARLEKGVAR